MIERATKARADLLNAENALQSMGRQEAILCGGGDETYGREVLICQEDEDRAQDTARKLARLLDERGIVGAIKRFREVPRVGCSLSQMAREKFTGNEELGHYDVVHSGVRPLNHFPSVSSLVGIVLNQEYRLTETNEM